MLDATANVINLFAVLMVKKSRTPPHRCPRCGSYRFGLVGDLVERDGEQGWLEVDTCSACGYRGENETFQSWETDEELDPPEHPVEA